RLAHPILAQGLESPAGFGMVEPEGRDAVEAALEPGDALRVVTPPIAQKPLAQGCAQDAARVLLLELIAVDGIVEEIGEVREQVDAVADRVGLGDGQAGARALAPLA